MDLVWQAIGDAFRLIVRADADLIQIASLSLLVSGAATALAAAIGIPLGIALHVGRFPGRATTAVLVNAGMALPPVVVGLAVMLALWRTGPLGSLGLLFTPSAMVIAQVIVALPLIAGFTRAAMSLLDPDLVLAMRPTEPARCALVWSSLGPRSLRFSSPWRLGSGEQSARSVPA